MTPKYSNSINNYFILLRYDITSVYMDEKYVCIVLHYTNNNVITVMNSSNLDLLRSFGQTLEVESPFYIFESDFTNYINVRKKFFMSNI
jgi:hypothetical protein